MPAVLGAVLAASIAATSCAIMDMGLAPDATPSATQSQASESIPADNTNTLVLDVPHEMAGLRYMTANGWTENEKPGSATYEGTAADGTAFTLQIEQLGAGDIAAASGDAHSMAQACLDHLNGVEASHVGNADLNDMPAAKFICSLSNGSNVAGYVLSDGTNAYQLLYIAKGEAAATNSDVWNAFCKHVQMSSQADVAPSAAITAPGSPATGPKTTQGTFVLNQQEAEKLLDEVAHPLFLAECCANGDKFTASCDPDSWLPTQTLTMRDLDGRTSDYGDSLPTIYLYELSDLDVEYSGSSPRAGSIFGGGSHIQNGTNGLGISVSNDALTSYFQDAFGDPSLIELVAKWSGQDSGFWQEADGSWRIGIGDSGFGVDLKAPAAPVNVTNGQVSFQGCVLGLSDGTRPEELQLKITLDVEQAPDSRYGCHVLGYSLSAVDSTGVQQTTPKPQATSRKAGAPSSTGFDSNGFVFADSSERRLTDADLAGLSKKMLGFARNEIFARHGNLFRKDEYKNHYAQYPWYQNMPNKRYDIMPEDLSDIERVNVELIQSYESGHPAPQTSPAQSISTEEGMTEYLLSNTFTNSTGDILTFQRTAGHSDLLTSLINGEVDLEGWNYGEQYGAFSMVPMWGDDTRRLFCGANEDGSVQYDSRDYEGTYYPSAG